MIFKSRLTLTALAGLALIAALLLGFQVAIYALKTKIETLLGTQGQIQEIHVKPTGVEILGLKIAPPQAQGESKVTLDWPAIDPLRADRIFIELSLIDLVSSRITLQNVRIEGASIALLRARDGRLKILPGLLESAAEPSPPSSAVSDAREKKSGRPLTLKKIELIDAALDFFDASLQKETHKIRIEHINATLKKINVPEFDGFTSLDMTGVIQGNGNDGKITLTGAMEFSTLESGLAAHVHGADILLLRPYLLKKEEKIITGGTLDIEVKSAIRQGKLHAPGTLTINNLRLLSSDSGVFMGLPSGKAASLLKNHLGKMSFNFVLEGRMNDPKFSLNESLALQISSSLADYFGLPLTLPNTRADTQDAARSEAAKTLFKTLRKTLK